MHQLAEREPDQHDVERQNVYGNQGVVRLSSESRNQSGDHDQCGNEKRKPVVEVGQHSQDWMPQSPVYGYRDRCEQYECRNAHSQVRQVGPAEAKGLFDKLDVLVRGKYDDEQDQVHQVCIGDGGLDSVGQRPVIDAPRSNHPQPAETLVAAAGPGLVHTFVHANEVAETPGGADDKYGDRHDQGRSAREFQQFHFNLHIRRVLAYSNTRPGLIRRNPYAIAVRYEQAAAS